MESSGLISICTSAFLAVFFILILLALIMRLILILFPAEQGEEDPALIAAITTAINSIYPGSNIIKIEEKK
jgi:hypothetical protein